MSDLLEAVLNDPATRTDSQLPAIAANAASEFAPWANVAE